MKKPLAELCERDLETVEDVINVLLTVPKGYLLHPAGQKCQIGVDHVHECVYLEDPIFLNAYATELIEEAKEEGEDTEMDVSDEKLVTYRQEVYVVMGYEDVCQNGNYEASLQGVFSSLELAKECGDELVSCGNIHHYEIQTPLLDEFGYC